MGDALLAARESLSRSPRARPWTQGLVLALFLGLVSGAGVLTLLSRQGVVGNLGSKEVVAGLFALLFTLWALCTWVALTPNRLLARLLVLPASAALVLIPLLGSGHLVPGGILRGAATCGFFEVLVALTPLWALWALLRGFDAGRSRAAAAGLAAGLTGTLVMHLHCPNGGAMHLLLGHALPVALLTMAMALWSPKPRPGHFAP
jgi:hypothetical protein